MEVNDAFRTARSLEKLAVLQFCPAFKMSMSFCQACRFYLVTSFCLSHSFIFSRLFPMLLARNRSSDVGSFF